VVRIAHIAALQFIINLLGVKVLILHCKRHNNGGNYAWCDGHVSWISADAMLSKAQQWFQTPTGTGKELTKYFLLYGDNYDN
jgi:prepilin-type processing-associated H-X9-DG protein